MDNHLNHLTHQIIGCVHTVSNTLGCGFVEKVYQNALVHELRKNGLTIETQPPITVYYDGIIAGQFVADIIVEQQVLLELKAVQVIEDIHVAQALNYLKATELPVCLLINFGTPKAEVRRLVPYDRWKQDHR